MPGEFVASPRNPFSSQPINFHRSAAQAQASENSVAKDMNEDVEPGRRSSLESRDSIAKEKQTTGNVASKSSIRTAIDKVRIKLSSTGKDKQVLDGSEEEFERKKERDVALEKRKHEEEKFGVKDRMYMNING